MFVATVEQIWKNRDRSGAEAKLTTVGFGGTGNKDDLVMAGIPASVENVRLDNAFYTTFIVLLIPVLLPTGTAELSELFGLLIDVVVYLDDNTFAPPYFAQMLPRIPVENFYDKFMDPGALPLQYVEMPPDEYIRELFIKTSFASSDDLAALYTQAASYFGSS